MTGRMVFMLFAAWWLCGSAGTLLECVRDGEITVHDLVMVLLGGMFGPLTFMPLLERLHIVLWKRRK
jgi:hypothetical protein